MVTGNQTPHFLSACRPNYTALGCQSTTQYIAERRACTGNPLVVMSARKSFPSKDAALSVYCALYTVVGWIVPSLIRGDRVFCLVSEKLRQTVKVLVCLVLLSVFIVPFCACPIMCLSSDVRDTGVQDQRHSADQADHQPHPPLPGHAGWHCQSG